MFLVLDSSHVIDDVGVECKRVKGVISFAVKLKVIVLNYAIHEVVRL